MKRLMTACLLLFLTGLVPTSSPDLCAPPGDLPTAEARIAAREQRLEALEAAVRKRLSTEPVGPADQALAGLLPCLTIRPVNPDGRLAAVVDLELDGVKQYGDRLVWYDGLAWRVQSLHVPQYPELIQPLYVHRNGNRLELIAAATSSGSGGHGRLQLYELSERMRLLWQSQDSGEHLSTIVLSPEWVTTIDRAPETWEEPHALVANCCLPVDRQILWQRQNSGFRPVSQRIIPNPYRAVSLFVGALRRGDEAVAARFASDPALVAEGAALIGKITTDEWAFGSRYRDLDLAEARAWEAIPSEFRTPRPTLTRAAWPVGPYEIVTERFGDSWLVTAIQPQQKAP